MTAAFLRDEPESSRVCHECGTNGLLGQYLSNDDTLVWVHPRCAQTKGYEALDSGHITEHWEE